MIQVNLLQFETPCAEPPTDCGGAPSALAGVLVSHNLGLVEHIAERVVILYLGRVVEIAPSEDLFRAPNHPYTQAIVADVPSRAGQAAFLSHQGRAAVALCAAGRLPLPSALPRRHGALPRRASGARRDRAGRWSDC